MESAKKAPIGKARALFDFQAENDGELSFKADDVIWVLDKDDIGEWDGWWEGRCERTKQEGFFPAEGWVEELPFEPPGSAAGTQGNNTGGNGGVSAGNTPPASVASNPSPASAAPAESSQPAKPAIPTAPKPEVKKKSTYVSASGGEAVSKTDKSPSSPHTTAGEKDNEKELHDGNQSHQTPAVVVDTPQPHKEEPSAIPKGSSKEDLKDNHHGKDKDKKDNKKDQSGGSSILRSVIKKRPKRKAPKLKNARDVELSDPYGFKKVAGFERRASERPEDQIAKLYDKKPEEIVAPEGAEKSGGESDGGQSGGGGGGGLKRKGSKRHLTLTKEDKDKKKKREEKERKKEEERKAEEERKKKEKEEKKKAKEDAKKKEAAAAAAAGATSTPASPKDGSGHESGGESGGGVGGGGESGGEGKTPRHKKEEKEKKRKEEKEKKKKEKEEKEKKKEDKRKKKEEDNNNKKKKDNHHTNNNHEPEEEVLPPPSRIVKPKEELPTPTPVNTTAAAPAQPTVAKGLPSPSGDPLLDFLQVLKLESLLSVFRNEEMEFPNDFIDISHEELTSLGIKMGPRRRIILAMQQYQAGLTVDVSELGGADKNGDTLGKAGLSKSVQALPSTEKVVEKPSLMQSLRPEAFSKPQDGPTKSPRENDDAPKGGKGAKKQDGWVFPEDAEEEGVSLNKGDGADAEKVPNGAEKEAEKTMPSSVPTATDNGQYHSYAVLTSKPLPSGVDKMKLESYLSPEEFSSLFGMTKEAFYAAPAWKQRKLKQEKNLF